MRSRGQNLRIDEVNGDCRTTSADSTLVHSNREKNAPQNPQHRVYTNVSRVKGKNPTKGST